MPQGTLPMQRFAHPEDARTQIQRAMEDHRQRLDGRPGGCGLPKGRSPMPPRKVMIDCGVRWIATDEAILARSLAAGSFTREDIYEPYRLDLGGKSLAMFFRDHELSDAVGFVYNQLERQRRGSGSYETFAWDP